MNLQLVVVAIALGLIVLLSLLLRRKDTLVVAERKELDRLKDEFLSTVSHELRTPLTIVKEALDNLRDGIAGNLNEEQKKVVNIGRENVDRLTLLISDLLDLSRLESGKATFNKAAVDLQQLIRSASDNLGPLAERKRLSLITDLPEDLPQVFADADMINQVITNLVSNALRFARSRITIYAGVEDEKLIKISVIDDGKGVSKKQLQMLFDKFVQTSRPQGGAGYQGTGLGLSICKRIVDAHNGQIWVESEEGKGAQFHFTLNTLKSFKSIGASMKKKILVVDDERVLVELLKMRLGEANYEVLIAHDGQEGLETAKREKPDLILLDIMMPKMDGYQVCRLLKFDAAYKQIPIIMLTARGREQDQKAAHEVGADDFIVKPFDPKDLLTKIATFLD